MNRHSWSHCLGLCIICQNSVFIAEANVPCQFPFVTSRAGYCLLVEGTYQQNDKAGLTRNPGVPRYKGQQAHLGGNPRAPLMKKC